MDGRIYIPYLVPEVTVPISTSNVSQMIQFYSNWKYSVKFICSAFVVLCCQQTCLDLLFYLSKIE